MELIIRRGTEGLDLLLPFSGTMVALVQTGDSDGISQFVVGFSLCKIYVIRDIPCRSEHFIYFPLVFAFANSSRSPPESEEKLFQAFQWTELI